MSQLSRRGFFLTWLVGVLGGWLGRSQAKAAAPALTAAPKTPGPVGDVVSLTVSTSDGVGTSAESFTWQATGLPPGTLINSNTGLITGTISQGGSKPTPP